MITITGAAIAPVRQAASEGTIEHASIAARPLQRPADVLEAIPGLLASQHSGEGKANQYYLRGFNLDHGTDFAVSVDGMPINQPSHAHGQGYLDMNFLIPEVVRQIDYRKGVYRAAQGDFSAAGSADIALDNGSAPSRFSLTRGMNGYQRSLVTVRATRDGNQSLGAVEHLANDGPWETPQDLGKLNALLRFSHDSGDTQDSLTLMSYHARWLSTDQIPQRAVSSGMIGRYGSVDPSDGGHASRHSLSWQRTRAGADQQHQFNAYLIDSSLGLRSNFTYFLDDPVQGDQFEQAESRLTMGGGASTRWLARMPWHDLVTTTVGATWRRDRISPLGLYTARNGARTGVIQESRAILDAIGIYAEQDMRLGQDWRLVTGLRGDALLTQVSSSSAANAGSEAGVTASPKLAVSWTPTPASTLFFNAGQGFHSNDARGINGRIDPRTGHPTQPAHPLVKATGMELGWLHAMAGQAELSASLWQLALDSELVFSGDAGTTEARGASQRQGLELHGHLPLSSWCMLDGSAAWSSARFTTTQGDGSTAGKQIPGAARSVLSGGITLLQTDPWEASLRIRYMGPRPLNENGSAESRSATLTSLRIGRQLDTSITLHLDVFNLFNRRVSDIDYFYVSRLPGEQVAGVADIHSHPVEPRQLRLTLSYQPGGR